VRFGILGTPKAWDILGWREVMQHHNAPTRLMDWSSSPFIALWFALDGHNEGDGDMALWVYDRDNAAVNFRRQIGGLKGADDYEQLDDRRLQNRLVQLVIDHSIGVLVPVRPRQFPRAVAQQSVLTVSPSIGVARPASWWISQKLATRIRLREEWKQEMQDACRSLGYSRPSLFRDLDSLGKSIAQEFTNSNQAPDFTLG
jgi:FRG domain